MSIPNESIIPRLARLRASPRPRILFISHARGGGVTRHWRELANGISGNAHVLLLRPYLKSFVQLSILGEAEPAELWFQRDQQWPELVSLLNALGITRVHYHHVHGLPGQVLDLAAQLSCPCDVTLHDYFPICPQYQLTDASGRYCGEPDAGGCARCIAAVPVQWPLEIDAYRQRFAALLAGAERVIAPSRDVADRIARYFPAVSPLVWPHAEDFSPTQSLRKVLVPGGISTAKGFDLLEACARDAQARSLPLHFRVLGFIAKPLPAWPLLPLSFTGEFAEGTLPALLALERGDVVFFPAQWPETWSYTLSNAIESGLPILATDLGSLPERLAGRAKLRILPWNADAARFNDALLELAGPVPRAPPTEALPGMDRDDYHARYVAAFASLAPRPDGELPSPGSLCTIAPHEQLPQPTLLELFDDGVRCGNGSSQAELGRRARDADERIASLGEAMARIQEADSRVQSAQAELAAVTGSFSWRLTAPLRALAALFRRRP